MAGRSRAITQGPRVMAQTLPPARLGGPGGVMATGPQLPTSGSRGKACAGEGGGQGWAWSPWDSPGRGLEGAWWDSPPVAQVGWA